MTKKNKIQHLNNQAFTQKMDKPINQSEIGESHRLTPCKKQQPQKSIKNKLNKSKKKLLFTEKDFFPIS